MRARRLSPSQSAMAEARAHPETLADPPLTVKELKALLDICVTWSQRGLDTNPDEMVTRVGKKADTYVDQYLLEYVANRINSVARAICPMHSTTLVGVVGTLASLCGRFAGSPDDTVVYTFPEPEPCEEID